MRSSGANAVASDLPAEELADSLGSGPERRTFGLIVLLVLLVAVVATGFLVGPNLMRQARRWNRGHAPLVPPVEHPIAQPSSEDAVVARIDRTSALAADAQISPPRRRVAAKPEDSSTTPADPEDPGTNPPPDTAVPVVATAEGSRPKPETPAPPAPQSEPDLTEGMLEAAARLVSLSWQEFDYPVQWNASPTSRAKMVYGHHRNRLLKAIAHPSPSGLSLDMARKDYAAARAQFSEDPRLDYAFGLVLWRHDQHAEAIDMFQVAARLDGVPFLPAALAVAWGRFLNHDERRGLDQLAHVSRILASSTEAYPPESQRQQAAVSIGRALGYLTGPGRIPELDEPVRLTSLNILNRLPLELRVECENGRDQVGQRQSELLQLTDIPLQGLQSGHRVKQDELQTRIDELRADMRDARLSLTRGRLTHVESIRKTLTEALNVRSQMEKLRPTLKKLTEATTLLARPQGHLDIKIMPTHFYQVDQQIVTGNSQMTILGAETTAERASRISKLTKIREERKKIEKELAKLRDEQADLVARRNKAEQDHRLEKEEARQERVLRIREQQDLEKKLQELNQALRRTMTLREGVETIAAYIPWNIEVEGAALWQALNQRDAARKP
jgi:hypothetical protein